MINDPIPFLANIAFVAYADGTLSGTELGQLETIRQELKLKKGDLNAALRMVDGGNYQITPVGSFGDQVKNLELILRVAYADDDLDKAEASIIRSFCKTIGITQEQLNRLCKDVLATLKNQGKVCPSCGINNDKQASFCSKCGASLDAHAQDIQVNAQIPSSGIVIEFADSTAAAFSKALELAKATAGYQAVQKGKRTWHLAVFPSGKLIDALPLAECLSGMRNRAVYINGTVKQWNEVLGFTWCVTQRSTAYDPVGYCFGKDENRLNPWSCKQAHMDWTEWADWFCYGKWEKASILGQKMQWRFDKDRIRHELNTNLFRFRFCPHMVADLPELILKHLPDTVVPESDPNWAYHEEYEQVPGAIKVVRKERSDGITFNNEFWADGVKPKGLKVFADILTEAFKDLGIQPQMARSLLK